MVHDQVIDFLRINGPSLPLEIGKAIGYNSFVTKAILMELINKGVVNKSKKPIGGSLLYYLPEQANDMRQKVFNDLGVPEKKVLERLRNHGQVKMSELSPHERAFLKTLLDFISIEESGNDYLITHHSFNGQSQKEPIKPEPKSEPEPERLFKHEENNSEEEKEQKKDFKSKAKDYISTLGEIKSINKVRAKREYDFEVKVTMPYPQELYVKAKRKKSINERDLSLVYAEALRQKKPAIIVTTGKLSKKATKWKKDNVGGLVKVIQIKD